MSNLDKDLTDVFEEPPNSTPVAEALKPQEVPEYTEEDMELAGMGFNLAIAANYKEKFEKAILHQGFPTNGFFDYYLDCSDDIMIESLKAEKHKFRENQQTKLEVYEMIKPVKDKVGDAKYIEYNQLLIKEKEELQERIDNLLEENQKIFIYKEIAKKLIEIFIEQGIKAELTKEEIKIIKELNKSD